MILKKNLLLHAGARDARSSFPVSTQRKIVFLPGIAISLRRIGLSASCIIGHYAGTNYDWLNGVGMAGFWDKQIDRAEHLAGESSGAKELLAFYARLLGAQAEIYESFRSRNDWLPAGDLVSDVTVVQSSMIGLLECVARYGPESLAEDAQLLLAGEPEVMTRELLEYWRNPSDTQFFAKAVLQPYALW